MNLRAYWPAAVAAIVVVGACLVALLSRALESLEIRNSLGWGTGALFVLLLLGAPIALIAALFVRTARRIAIVSWVSLLMAWVLSQVAHNVLAYPYERSLRVLIDQFDPIVTAVKRFEAEKGQLPGSLDELVPAYLAGIPHGKMLGWRIHPEYQPWDGWHLRASGYVEVFGLAISGTSGGIEYDSDGQYPEYSEFSRQRRHGYWGLYRGWRWVIWD
jgi:hypothetical protein